MVSVSTNAPVAIFKLTSKQMLGHRSTASKDKLRHQLYLRTHLNDKACMVAFFKYIFLKVCFLNECYIFISFSTSPQKHTPFFNSFFLQRTIDFVQFAELFQANLQVTKVLFCLYSRVVRKNSLQELCLL